MSHRLTILAAGLLLAVSAQSAGLNEDEQRMADLDASFQREQLILEVLLDIRDTLVSADDVATSKSALEKLNALRKLTRLR